MVQMYPTLVDNTRRYFHVLGAMVDDGDSVRKHDQLKKVKTNRPKYFVLHAETSSTPARLEYFDKKTHWENKKKPKKTIYLKTCFSINAFSDSKVKYGMTLYFRDDSFQIGFDTEEERDSWLFAVRALSHSDTARPNYQHVWNVKIKPKGVGKNYEGEYRLCLNDRQVILVRKNCLESSVVFPIEVVRRCGHTSNYFNIEVGRQACTGDGELWMELEDNLLAQQVHHCLLASKEEDGFRSTSNSVSSRDRVSVLSPNRSQPDHLRPKTSGGKSTTKIGYPSTSPMGTTGSFRRRSESTDSKGTSSSLSADDSDQPIPRATTPDPRGELIRSLNYLTMSGNPNSNTTRISVSSASVGSVSSDSDSSYAPMLGNSLSPNNRLNVVDPTSGTVPYMAMSAGNQNQQSNQADYMDMVPTPSSANDVTGYIDMTANQKRAEGCAYLEMNSNSLNEDNKNRSYGRNANPPYIEMTSNHSISSKGEGEAIKPDMVRSYLAEDRSKMPQRHYSVGSRPHKNRKSKVDDSSYVEMSRNSSLSEKEKSCSAPHLMPLSLASNPDLSHLHENFGTVKPPSQPDTFMMMDFEKSRTDFYGHRPRGATWSETTRPRSSSHGNKHKPSRMNKGSSKDSVKSSCSDYMDMVNRNDSYVEMAGQKDRGRKGSHPFVPQLKLSPPKIKNTRQQHGKSNSFDYLDMNTHMISPGDYVDVTRISENSKANSAVITRHPSQSRAVSEPFPELSGSSEEDISYRSTDSSNSKMSASSSHSSLHRSDDSGRYNLSGYGLDSEVYVDCQPATSLHGRTSSMSLSQLPSKPTRVASFISDDAASPKSSSPPTIRSHSPLINPHVTAVKASSSTSIENCSSASTLPASESDYMEVTPRKQSLTSKAHLPKPNLDSYMEMQPSKPTLILSALKPLPKITRPPSPSEPDSSASTVSTMAMAVSEASQSTTGHGSSSESNTTVVDDSYSLMEYPQQASLPSPPTSKPAKTSNSIKCPKPGISYIRQTSNDVILPTPMVPAPCYIRATSISSQTEDMELTPAPTASTADNAALMDMLLTQARKDTSDYDTMNFPLTKSHLNSDANENSDPYMMMDTTGPVSPIKLQSSKLLVDLPEPVSPRCSNVHLTPVSPSSRPISISEESELDITSAAELQQRREQNILHIDEGEEKTPTITPVAPVNVPCYITEDKPKKHASSISSKVSVNDNSHHAPEKGTSYIIQDDKSKCEVFSEVIQKNDKMRKPAPALPPKRHSAEKPAVTTTRTEDKEQTVLNYVDLDLESTNVPLTTSTLSPKPKLSVSDDSEPSKPTVYVKIDHQQTELLMKRKSDKK